MLKKDLHGKTKLQLTKKERAMLLFLAAGLIVVVAFALYLAAHSGSGDSLSSPAHATEQPVHGD
jgi:hypothetical protein